MSSKTQESRIRLCKVPRGFSIPRVAGKASPFHFLTELGTFLNHEIDKKDLTALEQRRKNPKQTRAVAW